MLPIRTSCDNVQEPGWEQVRLHTILSLFQCVGLVVKCLDWNESHSTAFPLTCTLMFRWQAGCPTWGTIQHSMQCTHAPHMHIRKHNSCRRKREIM